MDLIVLKENKYILEGARNSGKTEAALQALMKLYSISKDKAGNIIIPNSNPLYITLDWYQRPENSTPENLAYRNKLISKWLDGTGLYTTDKNKVGLIEPLSTQVVLASLITHSFNITYLEESVKKIYESINPEFSIFKGLDNVDLGDILSGEILSRKQMEEEANTAKNQKDLDYINEVKARIENTISECKSKYQSLMNEAKELTSKKADPSEIQKKIDEANRQKQRAEDFARTDEKQVNYAEYDVNGKKRYWFIKRDQIVVDNPGHKDLERSVLTKDKQGKTVEKIHKVDATNLKAQLALDSGSGIFMYDMSKDIQFPLAMQAITRVLDGLDSLIAKSTNKGSKISYGLWIIGTHYDVISENDTLYENAKNQFKEKMKEIKLLRSSHSGIDLVLTEPKLADQKNKIYDSPVELGWFNDPEISDMVNQFAFRPKIKDAVDIAMFATLGRVLNVAIENYKANNP